MKSWYVPIPSRCMKRYTLVLSMNSREGSQMKGSVCMVLYILAWKTESGGLRRTGQNDDGNLPACKVLLVANSPVHGQQEIHRRCLRRIQ